jgi:BirA family transcriptional regulator, biotin operon repressor / biotin---[acetyl-CoA-carboxylase] ligase
MTRTSPRSLRITTSYNQPPWIVEWHESLDTTMERAKEIARSESSTGRVVVSDYQSQGRGTHGRTWVAPPGTCLMFSFVIHPRIAIPALATLPATIAATVRDALNTRFMANVTVDPPNDLTICGRKLAGVLCQSHLRGKNIEWVVCGIGLNTNLSATEVSVPDSTSLSIACGGHYSHRELLEYILTALDPLRQL